MSTEEKSKLILLLQDMVAQAKSEAATKEREKNEILGKLDALLDGQSSSKKQIDELNATIRELKKELGEKEKSLLEKEKLLTDLRDQLSRRNSDLFGS